MSASTIRQEYDENDRHRLVVDGEHSAWFPYRVIAQHGDYRGTSPYWADTFPRVFKVEPVEGAE